MKLGSFVQDSAVNVTPEEVNEFNEILDKNFGDIFPNKSIKNNTWECVEISRDKERISDCVFVKAIFRYSFDDYVYGINANGDTIKLKGLTFELHHEVGHCINIEEEKLNEDKKQWQLWVVVNGNIFKYKSSTCHTIECDGRFQYDTDFKEFDLDKIRKWLDRTLSFAKLTPKQLKKVKIRFDKK